MEEMKVCPFCGKEILAVAKMCKYCREWLPDESTNPNIQMNVENSPREKSFSTEGYTQDKKPIEAKTVQPTFLSREERDARIEELKKTRNKLMFEKTRAKNAGLDTSDIMAEIKGIQDELHKLEVEKGLENGNYTRSDDGSIVVNEEIEIKLPFWERWFYRFF